MMKEKSVLQIEKARGERNGTEKASTLFHSNDIASEFRSETIPRQSGVSELTASENHGGGTRSVIKRT
jgi:hypothetical protein